MISRNDHVEAGAYARRNAWPFVNAIIEENSQSHTSKKQVLGFFKSTHGGIAAGRAGFKDRQVWRNGTQLYRSDG